ncbi:MAG: zf-HC2 domain-containing protein [Gammaproteobacteria bacterium]
MNTIRHGGEARIHEEISALIPWYVNGSIDEVDRQRVETHLPQCARCRDEVMHERGVYQGMNAELGVEYMPAASLKRLQARLDALSAVAPAEALSGPPAAAPRRGVVTWQGVMAASVAVMAVAVSMLAVERWAQSRTRAAPNYYTVTTSPLRAPHEVIRAVFIPTITLIELQAVLDEAGLRIVAGPTEAGVYSLATNSSRPVNASLALLRGHAKVRFAESIQPSVGPGDAP